MPAGLLRHCLSASLLGLPGLVGQLLFARRGLGGLVGAVDLGALFLLAFAQWQIRGVLSLFRGELLSFRFTLEIARRLVEPARFDDRLRVALLGGGKTIVDQELAVASVLGLLLLSLGLGAHRFGALPLRARLFERLRNLRLRRGLSPGRTTHPHRHSQHSTTSH